MRQTIIRVALAVGLAGGATALLGTSLAEGRRHDHQAKKAAYDANGDGVLDDAERAAMRKDFEAKRAARRQEALARYDANKDGQLDDAERATMRKERITARFQSIDTNRDGRISFAEFEAHARTMHR